jgi:hypothetical protein
LKKSIGNKSLNPSNDCMEEVPMKEQVWGLQFAKNIDRHKGEILVESSLGEGSIFQVVLPATAPLNRAFIQCLDIQFSGMLIDCCSAPRYDNRRNIIHETKIIL